LRSGKIFKLCWHNFDYENGTITLKDPKGGKTKNISVNMRNLKILNTLDINTPFIFPEKRSKQRV
jgi:hypothetical protein